MLLEFRVANYRSIRDEQVLSLVGTLGDKELAETHLVATGLKALPSAVRSAVLYGSNASGKSTLLKVLAAFSADSAGSRRLSVRPDESCAPGRRS